MGKRSWGLTATYLVFLTAAILLMGAIRFSNQKNQAVSEAFQRQAELNELGRKLASSSDYLTDEVRKYVVTTDITHLRNYWREILVTRSRDRVLARLKELQASAEEMALLSNAKAGSDALVATETRGMRLVLDAKGVGVDSMPAPVAHWRLTAGDRALTPAAKLERARNLQFGSGYDRNKALITGPIAEFQASVRRKTAQEVADAELAAQNASNLLMASGLLAITAMTLAFSLSSWYSVQRSRRIGDAVGIVSHSSGEILAAMRTHEQTVAQQAVAVNETTATMDEFQASFHQTKTLVDDSSSSALDARRAVDNGLQAVQLTMSAFHDLRQKVATIAEHILQLSEQTSQINTITNAVLSISAQTNMLALNAAVEAARAGEHGKGFAVVASEIRKLADQSKASAGRITLLVEEIQKATTATVMATENGTKTVDQGIQLAGELNGAFEKIMVAIDDVYQSAQQIAVSIQQESLAVQQVLEAMNAINSGAMETANGISRTQESLEKMNETAKNLTMLN